MTKSKFNNNQLLSFEFIPKKIPLFETFDNTFDKRNVSFCKRLHMIWKFYKC